MARKTEKGGKFTHNDENEQTDPYAILIGNSSSTSAIHSIYEAVERTQFIA